MSYQSKHTGTTIDNAITDMQSLQSIILNTVYPIGSYYISSDSANPSTKFGGTWEQIKDRMIMAAGSNYSVGATGGSTTHTHTSAAHTHTTAGHALTVSEMPSHKHYVSSYVSGWEGWSKGDIGAYFLNYGNFENPDASTKNVHRGSSGNYQVTNTGEGASHSHGNTGSTTPGNTGSSSSLPPYIVAYIWRRTA